MGACLRSRSGDRTGARDGTTQYMERHKETALSGAHQAITGRCISVSVRAGAYQCWAEWWDRGRRYWPPAGLNSEGFPRSILSAAEIASHTGCAETYPHRWLLAFNRRCGPPVGGEGR
jgi:hypothetical protein